MNRPSGRTRFRLDEVGSPNALIVKIANVAALSPVEIDLLEHACDHPREVPAHQDLLREGDETGSLIVILRGLACRYKMLPEGTRQITEFLMPGDCCHMHIIVLDAMDDTMATLTPCRVATIPRARVEELVATRPVLARSLSWAQLVNQDILKAWMVNLGRRNSVQRVAHLMCELYVRGNAVGLVADKRLPLDVSHAELGDALGLTAVHVCRVLRKLRLAGLMQLRAGTLTMHDLPALADVAGFDGSYLHLAAATEDQHSV
ncbi:Crp/Fnr family transcriptional regulator [Sphingomonas bacterium]|uniref:Crp/Fnr family transcriptional regulator n=1 Tax=Sphingomonas bacterium TaxID=1895847 RepID=UPI00157733E5|nr:Crp/Fnr family transcriptional regulator [Sphingomonas bacterium]